MADYTLIFDGGCRGNGTTNPKAYGSYCLRNRDGKQKTIRLNFGSLIRTNNQAEYSALIAGLSDLLNTIKKAKKLARSFTLEVRGDSALVLNQLPEGGWKCNSPDLRALRDEARFLIDRFGDVKLNHVRREKIVEILGH